MTGFLLIFPVTGFLLTFDVISIAPDDALEGGGGGAEKTASTRGHPSRGAMETRTVSTAPTLLL